jgi:precorrin-2/cobalt-factor-2 C20-methyltransferase
MTLKTGTLYGIGVGPGDPELITLKALKILEQTPHIFAATSSKNSYSLALNIVQSHLKGAQVEPLSFPMSREKAVLQEAWEKNARRVLEVLATGSDAAFITLGDPLTYSTFGYLLKAIKRLDPAVRVITIPGITSYQAAAALTQTPLGEGEDSFLVVSGARGAAKLRETVDKTDTVVLLKTYRHANDILAALEELGLTDRSVCISRCGLDGETVVEDVRALKGQPLPYFSMIIVRKESKGLG